MNTIVRKIGFFGISGCIAFTIDVLMMSLLSLFLSLPLSRGIAVLVAASSSWWINRKVTFKSENRAYKEWFHFLIVSSIGFVPNWLCYWWLMGIDNPMTNWPFQNTIMVESWHIVAIVPGVLLGMVCNFILSFRFVFRAKLSAIRVQN
jgi:putative flippase GtrA